MKGGKKVRLNMDLIVLIEAIIILNVLWGNVNDLETLFLNCTLLQAKKGEIRPPKLKTEDPNKSYVQRPVKRG